MEPKVVKNSAFERTQKAVAEYVASGHDVAELKKSDKLTKLVMDAYIRDENGRKLTLEEKFYVIGFPRKAKRNGDKKEVISQCIADFQKRTGKSVDEMATSDPEYQRLKDLDVYVDGKRLTLQEKFALVGIERERKYSDDVKGDLVAQIDEYLASGGSFHVKRETLPFYERLCTYKKQLRRNGEDLTCDQIMKKLGYHSYSDTYYRCMQLERLKDFRDEDGYCDAYKKDNFLKGYVIDLADKLQIPIPVLVCLVANEKLKKFTLDTEYFTFLKKDLESYYLSFGSLKSISTNNPTLYKRLTHANRYVATMTGEKTSMQDMMKLLGLDFVDNNFKSSAKERINSDEALERVRKTAEEKGEKLALSDFAKSDYFAIKKKAVRLGISMEEFLGMNGIEYSGVNIPRLSRVILDYYPYMNQMIERRDELLAKSGICEEKGYSKEEAFEANLAICIQTYEEFRDKIYNFDERTANQD